ncbi:XRE family transcriptional regulator [Acinetobacter pollinis]|uniref:Helix-turn-helix transcriptional regulator n=1 Tax=Acinetobacter pollinis TaxID=2605270 RepID=A0ABU6DP74_9GAMM|nr:S24 family peptidase [Acinetobacter pollinis]MEB5475510.1 helix-turn-helix transcriptional regulator [Acinetobacter pollinis]
MNIGENVRNLRRAHKLTQPKLAKAAKVSQSTISDLENGKKSVSAEILQQISKVLNTTIDNLVNGGDLLASKQNDVIKLPVSSLNEDYEIKFFETFSNTSSNEDTSQILSKNFTLVRVNKSMLNRNNIKNYNCISINNIGDSMSPKINDGDIAYIDISRNEVKDGKIFLVRQGDLFRLRRVYQLPNKGLRLVSDNKEAYPEERFTSEQIEKDNIEIIGWVWSWQAVDTW